MLLFHQLKRLSELIVCVGIKVHRLVQGGGGVLFARGLKRVVNLVKLLAVVAVVVKRIGQQGKGLLIGVLTGLVCVVMVMTAVAFMNVAVIVVHYLLPPSAKDYTALGGIIVQNVIIYFKAKRKNKQAPGGISKHFFKRRGIDRD